MYSGKEIYYTDKRSNNSINNSRKVTAGGFDYPKELTNPLFTTNFTKISEEQSSNTMVHQQFVNGSKKSDFAIPNIFSENNVIISNQCNSSIRNMINISHTGARDARYHYNDPTSFPRFISTPLILNDSSKDSSRNHDFLETKNFFHHNYFSSSNSHNVNTDDNNRSTSNDISNQFNHAYNELICPNSPYYYGDCPTNSYMHSYLIYDPQSDCLKNVMLVPQMMPMMNSSLEMNEDYPYYSHSTIPNTTTTTTTTTTTINHEREIRNFSYQDFKNVPSSTAINMNNNYPNLHRETGLESNGFSHDSKEDFMTFEDDTETGEDEIDESCPTKFQSLHSSNRNLFFDSGEYSSDDDQLNTVHGDEMLEELQKLSSIFTNVVKVSVISRDTNVPEHVTLFNNSSNLSRFKKTRIKERTTFWNNQKAIVKDNLVKIIPDNVLKIPFIDNERLDQMENDIFGEQLNKKKYQDVLLDQADCIHSKLQRSSGCNDVRVHKHSNRSGSWCRSTATPISLNEFPHTSNHLQYPNISSRFSHRKSLQIPIPYPLLVNKFIPMLSPVIPHRNKAFYDQSSNSNNINNNSHRKRRWSVSCSRLDSRTSYSPRTNCVNYQNESSHDRLNEFFEINSEKLSDKDSQNYIGSFESRIDHHLFCLKQSLVAQFNLSLRDMMSEIKSMKNTQTELKSQLSFYKSKLNSMEHSIRNTLPEHEWKSFGVDGINLGT